MGAMEDTGYTWANGTLEAEVADGTDVAAIYMWLCGENTMGISYMAFWGF